MIHRNHTKNRGFTLIELLVVVAIIALLISILLPSLSRAKEQARIAKCLANTRSICQSAVGYVLDNGNLVFAFPFDYSIDGYEPDPGFITEFIWGGGVPDKKQADWDPAFGAANNPVAQEADVYVIAPADRPLNKYISPEVSWSDPRRLGNARPRYNIPMDLPDFFKCPSDNSPQVPTVGVADDNEPEPDTVQRTWEWWGTSYAINWYWPYFYSLDSSSGVSFNNAIINRGKQILSQKTNRGASEFILFYENRCNYAFEGALPRGDTSTQARQLKGWHGAENYHEVGFFDGSARYQRMDTRYVEGPGWTTWPNKPWDGTEWEAFQNN